MAPGPRRRFSDAKLRQLREERGGNRTEFLIDLHEYLPGVTHDTLVRWETGSAVPSTQEFLALCAALDVPEDELTVPHEDGAA
jgi:transcriptional regulator with XRE-family HTH domain